MHVPTGRIFVPLKTRPFLAFASGAKQWELRLQRRQWNAKNLVVGARVELRLGYSIGRSLWGTIEQVETAPAVEAFFERVEFPLVVPSAATLADAVYMAAVALGAARSPCIGFRIALT